MRLFKKNWIAPKGLPFVCLDVLQHNGCQKIPKGPPFTFFGTVTLFKNLVFIFFPEVIQDLPRVPPSIVFILCNQLEFHKAQRVPPFTILSLRYSADFGRSRLVHLLLFQSATVPVTTSTASLVLWTIWARCQLNWATLRKPFSTGRLNCSCCNNINALSHPSRLPRAREAKPPKRPL